MQLTQLGATRNGAMLGPGAYKSDCRAPSMLDASAREPQVVEKPGTRRIWPATGLEQIG